MTDLPSIRRAQVAVRRVAAGVAVRPWGVGSLARLFGALNIWFWAIVGVPTLVAAVYYFGIASPQYMSEADFVVRGPTTSASMLGGMASLLQGNTGGQDDAMLVQEFMMSRDAVRQLERHDDLRAVLDRPGADIVSRFPGLMYWRNDFEALYKAYSRFVSVDFNVSTNVSTLEVKAYRPEDAQNIAKALLAAGERLINQLNERQREDAVSSFQAEVSATQKRIAAIQEELTAYRVRAQMLDPKSAAAGPLKLLAELNTQRAETQGLLADALRNSPNSPQIPVLRTRLGSLTKLIADESSKITGNSGSVAAAQTGYEHLDVALQLSEKQLASAYKSLEAARLDAQRQQLYLETIAQPNLPDFALYPQRIVSFSMVLATCLLVYGIAWLLVASVREHAAA
ncbi:MAG TPA: capsule biosynthesis protein [Stellaceae bacterium]|jgi:capsular polysaccharide transport system permease protein